MGGIILIIIFFVVAWRLINKLTFRRGKNEHNGNGAGENRFFSLFTPQPHLPFDNKAITWCANFLSVDEKQLKLILRNTSVYYKKFKLRKRSGGYRTISAPQPVLVSIQQTIYRRILVPVNLHPAATGFRPKLSIVHNVKPHLGKKQILKIDLMDFFGNIRQYTVREIFEKIGYPPHISEVLAELCCLNICLPQGACTSPALSNIAAYEMDKKLSALSVEHQLTYTRYADDLTFSGHEISYDTILPLISNVVRSERFILQFKKTKFIAENKRKIITGISISSGQKMTIPKARKRELRKNIHFVLTKGLAAHQQHIHSTDPTYLKRLIGHLSYWRSVEPDNAYVVESLLALKRMQSRKAP